MDVIDTRSDHTVSKVSNVVFHRESDLNSAMEAGQKAAAATGGRCFPMTKFKQGSRTCLAGAFPMSFIRQHLEARSAPKKGGVSEARGAINRPMDAKHSKNIGAYIATSVEDQKNYILPPFTLNVQKNLDVFVPDLESDLLAAYVVVPATTKLSYTDGQHRGAGISFASDRLTDEQLDEFDGHSVAVMITCESEIKQIHQDFADCSKTKPLPKSQLAVYDSRNPANGLVLDIIEHCPLFTGKIDATSSTLSKNSIRVFLVNQVRQLVKELLVGSYAEPEVSFETKAFQILGATGSAPYNEHREQFEQWMNAVTNQIGVLTDIACLKTNIEMNKIKELRGEGWICLTATGLNVIGHIGHEVLREFPADWQLYAQKLGQIDWRREARIWQGNIVRSGRITTQRAPLNCAVALVMDEIGLTPNPEHLERARSAR